MVQNIFSLNNFHILFYDLFPQSQKMLATFCFLNEKKTIAACSFKVFIASPSPPPTSNPFTFISLMNRIKRPLKNIIESASAGIYCQLCISRKKTDWHY